MIDVSVIICTFNRSEFLKDTLLACDKLVHDINIEVIVVDNNSSDNTKQVVENWIYIPGGSSFKRRYILEKRQGVSYARNTGLENAKGKIIAYVDDDAIPSEDWVQIIYDSFEKYPEVLAIGGKILPKYEIDRPEWLTPDYEKYLSLKDLGENDREFPPHNFPFGMNMAFRSEAISTLNFSTDLGRKGTSLLSGEESDFFERLARQGKIYYIAKMCVVHFIPKERLTQEWLLSRAYAQGVTDARMKKTTCGYVYKLRKSWFYYRRKARMVIDPKYNKNFHKRMRFASEKGYVDEFRGQSGI